MTPLDGQVSIGQNIGCGFHEQYLVRRVWRFILRTARPTLLLSQLFTVSWGATLEPFVVGKTVISATINTDEWKAYNHLPATGREHKSVNHTPGQRDGRGMMMATASAKCIATPWKASGRDCATSCVPSAEWSKHFLSAYVAVFEWIHNLKELTAGLLQAMVLSTLKTT